MKKILTLLSLVILYTSGKCQTTLSFDGADDYVAINKSYSSPISALTAEVWFKTSFNTAGDFSNWALICFDRSEYWHFSVEGDGRIGFHTTSNGGVSFNFQNLVAELPSATLVAEDVREDPRAAPEPA